jgi:glycerophosphoryl diester phosphodiesterase
VISTMSLAEVRSYDCGPLNGLPAGTPLPTLDEVFEATSGLRTPWGQAPSYDLHVKWEKETIDAATYASLVLASVRGHGVLERVHFMTDTSELLGAAKQQEPALSLYYLIGATNPQKLADAASLGVEALVPAGPTLSEGDVRAIHAIGAQVIAWTVNQPVAWASLGRSGVDGIITDNPIGLRQLQQGNSSSQSLGYVEDPEMPLED